MWNERYSKVDYAYGTEPNEYFKLQIDQLPVGKILLPAEGEGRNAVYAATKGWEVHCFDQSQEGKRKALLLAGKKGVHIDYEVSEADGISFPEQSFDAIAFIYAHFGARVKSAYHRQLVESLRPGGVVIFEAFSKKHLEYKLANPAVGGPDDLGMLFSVEEIEHDFKGLDFLELVETEVTLSEGIYHIGTGSVIRFLAVKR